MNKDQIIDKLNKIRALADRSEGGEREAAEAALTRIMDEHNISASDLETTSEEMLFCRIHGVRSWDLFKQVAAVRHGIMKMAYFGRDSKTKQAKIIRQKLNGCNPKGTNVVIFCTPSELVQVQYAYDLYQRSLENHLEAMFYGFLEKNKLLAPADPNNKNSNMTDEQIELAWRMGSAVIPASINRALTE